jgi:hypothetical protein
MVSSRSPALSAPDAAAGGERFVKSFRDRFNEDMTDQESQKFIEARARAAYALHRVSF